METPKKPEKTRLTDRVRRFATELGSFIGAGLFGRTRSVEQKVDPREELMAELQRKAAETDGNPGGVAFATLLELEKYHPGSVIRATEIDPDGVNNPRAVFVARVASIGGAQPNAGMKRTDLFATPFQLPDKAGVVTRIDLSVYPDSSFKIQASNPPRDRFGQGFSRLYEWSPGGDRPEADEVTEADKLSLMLAGIGSAASFEKPSE